VAFIFLGEVFSDMDLWTWVILLFINLYGFMLMGLDKSRAKQGGWRISERSLWITAICFGAVGTLLGMNVFRHKTRHNTFRIGFLVLAALQMALLYLFLK
jgi:uncharacterized membrane protein YsdA (DUF1294 family)